jgi:hypothetical protein
VNLPQKDFEFLNDLWSQQLRIVEGQDDGLIVSRETSQRHLPNGVDLRTNRFVGDDAGNASWHNLRRSHAEGEDCGKGNAIQYIRTGYESNVLMSWVECAVRSRG